MLLVKTKLDKSTIHGVGLFADEDIPTGTKVWEWTDGVDIIFTDEDLKKMPEHLVSYIKKYAWLSERKWYFCLDDAKFANHSNTPNLFSDGQCDYVISSNGIKRGEEMTYDYRDFHQGDEPYYV